MTLNEALDIMKQVSAQQRAFARVSEFLNGMVVLQQQEAETAARVAAAEGRLATLQEQIGRAQAAAADAEAVEARLAKARAELEDVTASMAAIRRNLGA